SEPTLLDLSQYVDQTLSQNGSTVCPPNLDPASYYGVVPTAATMPVSLRTSIPTRFNERSKGI
ncbi:hypothetical protein FRC11_007275, partial [Ceratobasidium sp. 423]